LTVVVHIARIILGCYVVVVCCYAVVSTVVRIVIADVAITSVVVAYDIRTYAGVAVYVSVGRTVGIMFLVCCCCS